MLLSKINGQASSFQNKYNHPFVFARWRRVALLAALTLCAALTLFGSAALADDAYPESAHDYANNMDQTWTYTYPEEADTLLVTFDSRSQLESGYDYLYLTDSNGSTTRLTGTEMRNKTYYLPGNTFTIRMTSDGSKVYWGFAVSSVEASVPGTVVYTVNTSGQITKAAMTETNGVIDDLVIPEEYDGRAITGIAASAFKDVKWLTGSVTIPDTITSMGNNVFQNCTGLKSLTFDYENRMTSVPDYLCDGCTGLTSVTMPYDTTSIGNYGFRGCTALADADLPRALEKIGNYAFQNCAGLTELNLPSHLTSIGTNAFNGCTNVARVDFPDTLTSIGSQAFYNCDALESVELPASVTSLGTSAFNSCDSLEYANLENLTALTTLPSSTFAACPKLVTVRLPETVTRIDSSAFSGCSALERINDGEAGILSLPDTVKAIGSSAFRNCDAMVEAYIPDSVTELGTYALADCDNLEKAVIGEGVTTLPSYLFSNDKKLKSIVFKSDQITAIPNYAFQNCESLEDFDLWEGLKSIGSYAFSGCSGLTYAHFPSTLTSIGDYAYSNNVNSSSGYCPNLTDITFEEGDADLKIGQYAFYRTGVQTIDFPPNLTSLGTGVLRDCASLTHVGFSDDCKLTEIPASAFYNCPLLADFEIPEMVKTIGGSAFYGDKALTDIVLPDGLETIGDSAFYNCTGLTSVVFPETENLKSIGGSAFYGTKITEVTLPASLTTLGASAFNSCSRLEKADLSQTAVTRLQSSTFRYDSALTELLLPEGLTTIDAYAISSCSKLTSIDLPDTVTTIGNDAFYYDAALTSITLPDSVTSIGTECFSACYKLQSARLSNGMTSIPGRAFSSCYNLTDVTWPSDLQTIGTYAFNGCTKLERADLPDTVTTIDTYAFNGCSALTHVTVPHDCTTVAANAFTNCKNLDEMLWDAKDGSIASFSSGTKFTLTLGQNVDNLSADALKTLIAGGANMLAFEGGNYLTLPSTGGSGFPRPLNNLDAGQYYADEQGALYRVNDDGTATLVYVPDGLSSYTIPAALPGANGGESVPVTGVKDNALYLAQSLTTLTVESPESFTALDSYAFAYAENLESVNGETTVAGATALFANAAKGAQLFYDTKLTDTTLPAPSQDDLVYDSQNNPEDAANGWKSVVVVIHESARSRRQGEAQNETPARTTNGALYLDPETGEYGVYTGESVTTSISISNPDSTAIADGDKIRVYFQFEDGGSLNYSPGTYTAVMESNETDANGNRLKENASFTVVETSKGCFYMEFDRPRNGYTLTLDVVSEYPSPTTGGGDALIWAEFVDKEQVVATAGQSSEPDDKYHKLNWTTKRDDFPVTKGTDTANPTVTAQADGTFAIGSQAYQLKMERKGDTMEGIAKDHMTSADFVDIITLPDGIRLNDAVRDDILNGRITYTGQDNQSKYLYAPSFGTGQIMTFYVPSNYTNTLAPIIELVEGRDDQLKLTWTYNNTNPNYTSAAQEITTFSATMTVAANVFLLSEDATPNTDYSIHNELTATEHFCYSDDVTENAEVKKNVRVNAGHLTMKKTGQSGYRGEYNPFVITLTNDGVMPLTATEVDHLVDTMDANGSRMHYIRAEDIERMFADQYGPALTITITSGQLYGYGTEKLGETYRTVTRIDGSTGSTSQQYTSTDTEYDAIATSDDKNVEAKDAEFTFTWENGHIRYTVKSPTLGLEESGITDDVQALFDHYGYFVTRLDTYEARWDFTKIENFQIAPGQSLVFDLRSTLKDTFMRINGDTREYDSSAGQYVNNYAYAYDENDKQLASAQVRPYYYNDARIDKSYTVLDSHLYEDDFTSFTVPDVVRYDLTANHYGTAHYDCMPLTDHMTGRQVMMVPVAGNERLAGLGLSTYPEEGEDGAGEYYLLDQHDTYYNVWTGEAWVDHVTVKRKEEDRAGYTEPYDTYDTYITWYLPDYGGVSGTQVTNMHFNARVLQNELVETMPIVDIFNETWLSDHESHRLYDYVSPDGGIYAVFPLVTDYDKKIVDYVGDTAPGYEYCGVTTGKRVVYRLTFENSLKHDFTLTGKDFYDILPGVWGDFRWSRENVKLDYVNFETNDPDDVKWSVVRESDVSDRIAWNWNDDDEEDESNFSMTCTSPDGIGYVYITVDFPDGLLWDSYVQHYNSQTLTNTLYVRDRTTGNYGHIDVEHDLWDNVVARMQKGVYATGGKTGEYSSYYKYDLDTWRDGVDSRLTYENDDLMKRKVYYYITLYNDGNTNLYLNEIQDVLPKGFTLYKYDASYTSTDTYAWYARRVPRVASSAYATVTGAQSYVSTYSWIDTTTETLSDGRQLVRMNLMPCKTSNYSNASRANLKNETYFQYNERLDKYYLKPKQAVVIRMECYTNEYDDTEDVATNEVAMPVYDFYALGVEVSDNASTAGNATSSLGNASKNDGGCLSIDTAQAGNLGFDTEDYDDRAAWLESDVTLTRGTIRPGINKRVTTAIAINSDNEEVVTNNPTFANPLDRLVWTVTARNDGDASIIDHTLSDRLFFPYYFDGTLTYQQTWNLTGSSTAVRDLFTIDRDTEGEGDAVTVLDTMTLTNSAGTAYRLTVDGAPVEVEIPNWTSMITGASTPKVLVAITSGTDDGEPYEALSIRFTDETMCIPDSGSVRLTVSTANLTSYMQNRVFYNTAFVTPMKQAWDGTVNEGNLTDYDTGLGDKTMSVRNSDQITTSYGAVTSAIKRIQEKLNPANAATSIDTINYIVLSGKEREFTYTLTVKNDATRSIDRIVLLDNLPEPGDHTTFQADDMRNSPFTVLLTQTPNFQLSTTLDGVTTVLSQSNYRVQLSKRTLFDAADWAGQDRDDWIDADDATDYSQYRSIRLIFTDPDATEDTSLFKPGADLSLTFDAIIDPEDPKAQPGLIAWNGFGYHYRFLGNTTELEAAPRLVGIKIPDYPQVTKSLINARGDAYVTSQDETFHYVLYSGSSLTGANSKASREAIVNYFNSVSSNSYRRSYTFLDVTVPAGSSASEALFDFNNRTGWTYDSTQRKYVEGPWVMTNKTNYTLLELPEGNDAYAAYTTGGTSGKSFTFQYDETAAVKVIASVNMHSDWSFKLNKVDQFGAPVSNAVFAIYTPVEREILMAEEDYEAETAASLSELFGLTAELAEKPAYTLTVQMEGEEGEAEETIYTLMTIAETAGFGSFQLDTLHGSDYRYIELVAPEHYQRNTEVGVATRNARQPNAIVTTTMTDDYQAKGETNVTARKVVVGRPVRAEEFRFAIAAYDIVNKRLYDAEDENLPPMPEIVTALNDADGAVTFGPIRLTQDDIGKTYYYQVTEIIPENEADRVAHIVYDTEPWIAAVRAFDQGDGVVGAEVSWSKISGNGQQTAAEEEGVFTNAFKTETMVDLTVSKTLTNKDYDDGETYTMRLSCVAAVNTEDGEAAELDDAALTLTLGDLSGNGAAVSTNGVMTMTFDQDDIGKTYTYALTELLPDNTVAFNGFTGERYLYHGSSLTWAVYSGLSEAGKGEFNNIQWRLNDVVYDDSVHTVVVTVYYENDDIQTSVTLDGEPLTSESAAEFENVYSPESARAVFNVRKAIDGRGKWLSRVDTYYFAVEAVTEGAPLPAQTQVSLDDLSDAATGMTNAMTGSFPIINYTRESLRNADGSYARTKTFEYRIREVLDPENAKATIVYDDDGVMTGYSVNHVYYDLSVHRVTVTLTEADDGALSTTVTYYDDENQATEDETDVPFVNTWRDEAVPFDVTLNKRIGADPAISGVYQFRLYDANGDALETLTFDADSAIDGVMTVTTSTLVGGELALKQRGAYSFTLIEVVPDEAVGYDADGNRLNVTWATASDAQKADETLHWNLNGVNYDHLRRIGIRVGVYYDDLFYSRVTTVTYSLDQEALAAAAFVNESEYHAEGVGRLNVRKAMNGRSLYGDEAYAFTLTAEDGAPLRIDNDDEAIALAYKLVESLTASSSGSTAADFGTMRFLLSDLDGETSKTFAYRIHEVVPDDAFVPTGDGEFLTWADATPEQRAQYAGQWSDGGVLYAADQTLTLRVTDKGDGTLSVTVAQPAEGDADDETPAAGENGDEDEPVADTVTATVTMTNTSVQTPVRFVKVDEDGQPLDGATFTVTMLRTLSGKAVANPITYTFEALDGEHTLALDSGCYSLTETLAPAGYAARVDKMYFRLINAGGQATLTLTDENFEPLDSQPDGITLSNDGDTVVMTLVNTPQKTTMVVSGRKTLRNAELTVGEFAFELRPCDAHGEPLEDSEPVIVYNDADGGFSFELTVSYLDYLAAKGDADAAVFRYLVREVIPNDADDDNIKDNIRYDDSRFMVTVTVRYVDRELTSESEISTLEDA